MRIAFLGTSDFAVPALDALAARHEIALVVTQPDRPVGRHARMTPPPVKEAAARLGLPVDQPARINTKAAIDRLRDAEPEVAVVAAYGQLLRPAVFDIPPAGTINIHASLLPAYRGAAPVRWAIVRGETRTGVTTFLIDEGMDTGDLLLQRAIDIDPNETAGALQDRLATLGADVILETLRGIESGTLNPEPQPAIGVSYAPMLTREDGQVRWSNPAAQVHDRIRGLAPWPGAWTTLRGQRVKLHRSARTGVARGGIDPGAIALEETGRLFVACSDDLLEILEIQREGRPRTDGTSFLHGLQGVARFDDPPSSG